MSVYTDCSRAARHFQSTGTPFTENDVVNEAATYAQWDESDWREATVRHAPQILAAQYRAKKIVRFGPVDHGGGEPDYVRQGDGKIVVAGAHAWQDGHGLVTPNGEFAPIRYTDDPIYKNGRRQGTRRDDMIPWDSPDQPREGVPSPGDTARVLLQRIERLEAEKAELAAENERLRAITDIDSLADLVAGRLRGKLD